MHKMLMNKAFAKKFVDFFATKFKNYIFISLIYFYKCGNTTFQSYYTLSTIIQFLRLN